MIRGKGQDSKVSTNGMMSQGRDTDPRPGIQGDNTIHSKHRKHSYYSNARTSINWVHQNKAAICNFYVDFEGKLGGGRQTPLQYSHKQDYDSISQIIQQHIEEFAEKVK